MNATTISPRLKLSVVGETLPRGRAFATSPDSRRFPRACKHRIGFSRSTFHSIRSHVPQIIPKSCSRTRRFLARGRQGLRRKRANIDAPPGVFPPISGASWCETWWPAMVGWKPLLRQDDAHTERFTERSEPPLPVCASLHVPSGSLQLSDFLDGRSQEPRETGSIVPRYPLIKSHIPEISRQCTFPTRVDEGHC